MRIFFTHAKDLDPNSQAAVAEVTAVLRKLGARVVVSGTEGGRYTSSTQAIAEADVVVAEASQEDFRAGFEVTLALLYGKPTLVLSRRLNYADYLPHELLTGAVYRGRSDLRKLVEGFARRAEAHLARSGESLRTIELSADALHMAALAPTRHEALRVAGELGEWARLAEQQPEKARAKIEAALGHLPIGEPWSAFGAIYGDDTPDYIFTAVARFVVAAWKRHGIGLGDSVADVAGGTGAVARNLRELGFTKIWAFDKSRAMLAEAFRRCADMPGIRLFEADIATVEFPEPVRGMAWVDYSSNFALTLEELRAWLQRLLHNLAPAGCLVFDLRTAAGWDSNLFRAPVTVYDAPSFQRATIHRPDAAMEKVLVIDRFIRTAAFHGGWNDWKRERLRVRRWSVPEVVEIVRSIPEARLERVYDDHFAPLGEGPEPALVYFEVSKRYRENIFKPRQNYQKYAHA